MERTQKTPLHDFLGTDYTEFLNSEEDFRDFQKLLDLQKSTMGVPLNECFVQVFEALRLSRKLRGENPETIQMASSVTEGLAKVALITNSKN